MPILKLKFFYVPNVIFKKVKGKTLLLRIAAADNKKHS